MGVTRVALSQGQDTTGSNTMTEAPAASPPSQAYALPPPAPPPPESAPPPSSRSSAGSTQMASASAPSSGALVPLRVYLKSADIPPKQVAAYGVVALRARPTSATLDRLMKVCESYKAHLPPQSSRPDLPPQSQMLTVWPLDNPDAPKAKEDDCGYVLDHYDVSGGVAAIADARRQGARLNGEGPFLIGWSPSASRGRMGQLVLTVDMSGFQTQQRIDSAFDYWQDEVIEKPALWRHGFSIESFRDSLQEFVNTSGPGIMDFVKLWKPASGA